MPTEEILKNNKINFDLEKHIELIGIVVVIIALIVGYFFFIAPELSERTEINSQLDSLQSEIKAKNQIYAKFRQIRKDYNSINTAQTTFVNEFLPNQLDLSSVVSNISYITTSNNLDLVKLDYSLGGDAKKKAPKNEENQETLVPVEIKLTVRGADYNKIKRLIKDLESNSRFIEINSFEFDPASTEHSLSISVYYYNTY